MNWFKSLVEASHPQRRIRTPFPLTRTEHFEPRLCLGRLISMQSDPVPAVPLEVANVPAESSTFVAGDTSGTPSSGNGQNAHPHAVPNEDAFTATAPQTGSESSTPPQSALNTQVSQSLDPQLVSAFADSPSNGAGKPEPSSAPIQHNNTELSTSTTGATPGTMAPAGGNRSTAPAAVPPPKAPGSIESKIAADGDNVVGGATASKLSADQLAQLGLKFDADGNAIGINSKIGTFDLWWKDAAGPVTVKYDFRSQGGYQNQITAEQKAIAVNALNDWSNATGGKLVFVQDTSAPASEIINIGVGDLQAVGYTGGQSVISLGGGQVTVTLDGKFTDAGVAWLDASQSWSMTSNNLNPSGTFDFYTIVAHEVGHAIGFGESLPSVTPDIMTDPYQGPMNSDALVHAVQNDLMYIQAGTGAPSTSFPLLPMNDSGPTLTSADVAQLLERASGASATRDAIIAVVDRNGEILGVRVEPGVLATIHDTATLVYAIDGAVAEARTAAMFSNANPDPANPTVAPLTSRTIEMISQSTITQREVQSTPDILIGNTAAQDASTLYGPGFVAPIGLGGHFPPGIDFTSPVDLFDIEHTNRDTTPAGQSRFNVTPGPGVVPLMAPESVGTAQNSGLLPGAQSRGIGTLPGGIPIMKVTGFAADGFPLIALEGGIGVFFPGPTGDASYEQGFVPGINQSEQDRMNTPLELEAEWMAFAAVGGTLSQNAPVGVQGDDLHGTQNAQIGTIAGVAPLANVGLPLPVPGTAVPDTIYLGGIALPLYGPGPIYSGVQTLLSVGSTLGTGDPNNAGGEDVPLAGGVTINGNLNAYRPGQPVANGWLVAPHAGSSLTQADVTQIIQQGIDAANATRAAIRLPLGSTARMVFAVTDTDGSILGLYRMPDATTFSIDVAVAKARNVSYYDSGNIKAKDQVVQQGVSFTNRTFRFLAEPRYPAGVENTHPPPFSTLNDPGIDPATAENTGAPRPAGQYMDGLHTSVAGYDAFLPNSNFHADPNANQNGVVFFPGSTALYRGAQLVGGLGVSGDGVDQDDTVTFCAAQGFLPSSQYVLRADQVFFDDARLPFIEFLRNAFVL